MKYDLIKPINKNYSTVEQILTNRNIPKEEIPTYLNTNWENVASPEAFGSELLHNAATELFYAVHYNTDTFLIVDADCDGFTSSALLYNYLYDVFPTWATAHLHYLLHDSKQHGLSDHIQFLEEGRLASGKPFLILMPDAGSNDTNECKKLNKLNCSIVILDHHICDRENPYAIIINNQNSDYPNKELSGVGVTWQFCRYLDKLLDQNYANNYLDLVALGDTADMMSLTSIETKYLIQEGLKEENIHNPFMSYMIDKNRYSIGDTVTPNGIAFYVAPMINAIVRSGTEEEKELIFESMLKSKAFEKIPSTKRGHKQGDMETVVEQAIRVATNVKARQTKAQDAGMELLEKMIDARGLLAHKVLLFLLEPGQIDKNIAGLVANKLMAKYQRPCCILTKVTDSDPDVAPWDDTVEVCSFQGSARGCDKVGVTEFKDICEATGVIMYATGHQGAFGLGIRDDNIPAFIEKTDIALADMPDETVYYVDYIWTEKDVEEQAILNIAELKSLWGKDLDEPLIAIQNLRVTPDMVTIYEKNGKHTLKIQMHNDVCLMLFQATEEDCLKLQTNNTGYIDLDIIAKCNKNEWMGNITPQLFIEDYNILDSNKYFF